MYIYRREISEWCGYTNQDCKETNHIELIDSNYKFRIKMEWHCNDSAMTSSHFLYKFIYCTLYLIYYFIYLDYSLSCHLFRFFLLNQLIKPFDVFCLNFYNISEVFSQILINITHNDNFLKIYKYKIYLF